MSWTDALNPIHDLGALANTGDTKPLTGEQKRANKTADQLASERAALGLPTTIATGNSDADRAMQLQAIQALQGAAAGTTASPAEIQLRDQAARNNAAAFGAAAALKGRTPGASFTTVARQNAENQLETNATAAALRAQEIAQARAALSGAIATQQQQDQQGAQTQAELNTNYANALLGGTLASQGQGVSAAGGVVNANLTNAQTENAMAGGLLGGMGQGLTSTSMGSGSGGSSSGSSAGFTQALTATSDRREKNDVEDMPHEQIEQTLLALKPKTFDYKNPDAPGEAPGHRVGIIAQDALKGPLGKDIVIQGKPLQLDVGNALGLALAGMADLTRRIKELEARPQS